MLTDYHVHLAPTTRARPPKILHGGQRRALPRGGGGAGDQRAGRRRAHPPLHRSRWTSGSTRGGRSGRATTSTRTAASCARRPTCGSGIEADFVAGREDRLANFLEPANGTTSSAPCTSSPTRRVDMERLSVWGRGESAEKVWRRYFETVGEAARTGMFDIMAHPDLVKVWGGERRCRAATCGATTSPPSRASSRAAWRSRCRPPGCASRSARSTRRARSWRRRSAPGCRRALERRAHARPARLPLRGRARAARADRRERDLRVRAPAAAARAGRLMRDRDRDRHASLRGGAAAGPRRRRDPGRARAGGPLRRRRAHARDRRRAARRGEPRRHRRALPRHRRAVARRRLDGAAARRARPRAAAGWAVVHVDATVVLERPKLAPHRDAIRESLATRSAQRQRQVHDRREDGLRRPGERAPPRWRSPPSRR